MKIAVFGTGGVGGYFGGRLAEAGADVHFIARGDHLSALQSNGLRVDSIDGDFHLPEINATDDPSSVGTVDVILVAVKAWQVPEAAEAMRPMVGPQTMIVPLENGVTAPDHLIKTLGEAPVLGGLCRIFSFIAAPGHIKHVGAEPTVIFGELDGSISDRARQLEGIFNQAKGLTVQVSQKIQADMWTKFMLICAMSGVGAITRAPLGVTRALPETRIIFQQIMQEIFDVAAARGIQIAPDAMAKMMAFIDSLPPHATASMQRDIEEGYPSELEAQNGAVVKLGAEVNVPTPTNTLIYASLLPQEKLARGDLEFPEA